MDASSTSYLYGIVDMGSNGIRFSITDLSSPSARLLPAVYTSRSAISLYDAQHPPSSNGSSEPIPFVTISAVVSALKRFKVVCRDFGVPDTNIKILATEATRTASNAEELLGRIREELGGWEVEVLGKEEEGRVGAWGIASGFDELRGLVLDLGGGSCQITWMIAKDGTMQTSPEGSASFPYGAAALTKILDDLPKVEDAREKIAMEIEQKFQWACALLEKPPELLHSRTSEGEKDTGLTLYLSGGGFRGWGYLLMSQSSISPYPIPIINGFSANVWDFQSTETIQAAAAATVEGSSGSIFRISKRRAAQVPAVAFLVENLVKALSTTGIQIKQVRFCQGGVREGYLFNQLSEEVRAQNPLLAAAASVRHISSPQSAKKIAELVRSTLPEAVREKDDPLSCLRATFIEALTNAMYLHSSHPKESASAAALHSTVHGPMAAAHGISHEDRAALAVMLCERWGSELPPEGEDLKERLEMLLSTEEVWWCRYVGRVAGLVGDVYPAGVVRDDAEEEKGVRIRFEVGMEGGMGKSGNERGIKLTVRVREGDPVTSGDVLAGRLDEIQKLGKKKNWERVGGKGGKEGKGWGIRVEAHFMREGSSAKEKFRPG